jgi:hypothetical protein
VFVWRELEEKTLKQNEDKYPGEFCVEVAAKMKMALEDSVWSLRDLRITQI